MDEHASQNPHEATLPEPREVTDLLDGIPDAYERTQVGLRQAEAGETVPLDEL